MLPLMTGSERMYSVIVTYAMKYIYISSISVFYLTLNIEKWTYKGSIYISF